MDWKQSLDRYLTTGPQDDFSPFAESLIDSLSQDFYNANEDWIDESDGLFNKWMNKLYNKSIDYKTAAKIIERAFKTYKPCQQTKKVTTAS